MLVTKRSTRNLAVREHVVTGLPDTLLRFSFRFLHSDGKFGSEHAPDPATYLPQLLNRLRGLSTMRPEEFRTTRDPSLRIHTHDWAGTTEKHGFGKLSAQLNGHVGWQFQLSANKHGRVHGILVDEVFYIVWLDPEHRLYQ
jgi:hypothetical protein